MANETIFYTYLSFCYFLDVTVTVTVRRLNAAAGDQAAAPMLTLCALGSSRKDCSLRSRSRSQSIILTGVEVDFGIFPFSDPAEDLAEVYRAFKGTIPPLH